MRRYPSRLSGARPLTVGAVFVIAATLAALGPAPAASAAPSPTPTPGAGDSTIPNLGPPTAGQALCTISATTLNEITGMVATSKGIYVVKGGQTTDPTTVNVYTVDSKCKSTLKIYNFNPVDPQDLAIGADGALWVGDTGDKDGTRDRIAVEKVVLTGTKAVPYRIVYPSGGKFDAKALLLDGQDKPVIITDNGGVYKPATDLIPDVTTNLPKLEKVGDFKPARTGTDNPQGAVGQAVITGAAKSPDGTKVVVRTFSDAYEFDVTDGDVAKAITSGAPKSITPLPGETQGEAISYSADGASFLTLSVGASPKLLKYTPYVPAAVNPSGNSTDTQPAAPGAGQSWLDRLSFSQMTRIVAAVGVVGLVLAIAGIVGIRRARRRRREEEEDYDYDDYDDHPRRRRGRDSGYGREGGYDSYGGAGYGSNGYADAGYGGNGQPAGQQYSGVPYSGGHGGGGYSTGQFGAGGYGGGQQQYAADQYGGGQQQYGADQYGGGYGGGQQQYGADQYGGGYPTGQYGGGQQQYGADQYGGGQYGNAQGYGTGGYYEDDFDPLRDPRRR
jgi:hypothetical protein